MNKIKLSLLFLFSMVLGWSQIPKLEKDLKVLDYKIINNDTLKVHWYNAASKNSKPTGSIAFFFGGGWVGGSYTHFQRQALYFSQRGLTTFLFDYRVETRHKTSPIACIKDARTALRFLKKNHLIFNIDPEKIISSGGSAGGHIAAATATLNTVNELTDDLSIDPNPFAMILFNPVFDNGPNGYHGSGAKELIEDDFRCYCKSYNSSNGKWATLFKNNFQDLSPFHNITTQTPPTLVLFGSEDHLVPVETAYEFQEQMKDQGNICQVVIYEGAKHGFFNGVRSKVNETNASSAKYFFDTLQAADDFLVNLNLLASSVDVKDYFE